MMQTHLLIRCQFCETVGGSARTAGPAEGTTMTATEHQEYTKLLHRWMAGEHTDALRDEMRPYAIKYADERTRKVVEAARTYGA